MCVGCLCGGVSVCGVPVCGVPVLLGVMCPFDSTLV